MRNRFISLLVPTVLTHNLCAHILWYCHQKPVAIAHKRTRRSVYMDFLQGAAYTDNTLWTTHTAIHADITRGRIFQGRWYMTSCLLRTDGDFLTLVVDSLIWA